MKFYRVLIVDQESELGSIKIDEDYRWLKVDLSSLLVKKNIINAL